MNAPAKNAMSYEILDAATASDIDHVRELMRHYNAFLGKLGVDLCFQDFNLELEALPGVYVKPRGNLWIAKHVESGAPLGCIAVKPLNATECEMKRLWVEDTAKGIGLGRALAETSIAFARDAGYQTMKLDTLRTRMPTAIALYRSLGFVETEAYVHNPEADVLYMKLNLG
jgi:putative acetyltransferase